MQFNDHPAFSPFQHSTISAFPDDDGKNNNDASDTDDKQDHHVKVHIETPYRKSLTPLPNEDPNLINKDGVIRSKRQLFQITPFPKVIPVISKWKESSANNRGSKESAVPNTQPKPSLTKVQRRNHVELSEATKVPFFAESNIGIVHSRDAGETFESFEKKHNILKIRKRTVSQVPGKNPILQLLRSSAGKNKQTQKILGLNSNSFDIFPGPMPSESSKLAKMPTQEASYRKPDFLQNKNYVNQPLQRQNPYNGFPRSGNFMGQRQQQGNMYFQRPIQHQGFNPRRGIRSRPSENRHPMRRENMRFSSRKMTRRGYGSMVMDPQPPFNSPQGMSSKSKLTRRGYGSMVMDPPPQFNSPQVMSSQNIFPPSYQPQQQTRSFPTHDYQGFADSTFGSMSQPQIATQQPIEVQQQEQPGEINLTEDQANQYAQELGMQEQSRDANPMYRQDVQSASNSFPGVSNGELSAVDRMNTNSFPMSGLPQTEAAQFQTMQMQAPQMQAMQMQPTQMEAPQMQVPQMQSMQSLYEEPAQGLTPGPVLEENPLTRSLPQPYLGGKMGGYPPQGYQPEQRNLAPQRARGRNVQREKQPAAPADDDDEEKPEVHVHISTEKRKKIAKPTGKGEGKQKKKENVEKPGQPPNKD